MQGLIDAILSNPERMRETICARLSRNDSTEREIWRRFARLRHAELAEHSHDSRDLLTLCEMQCLVEDLRELQERNPGRALSRTCLQDLSSRRLQPQQLFNVRGFGFFWGMQEPVPSKHANGKDAQTLDVLRRKLQFLHDVVHVERLIVLEARFFGPEREAWSKVCSEGVASCTLIAIPDWQLPSVDSLVSFGLEMQRAITRRETVACHCIAGNGRTGLCLLFLFMFTLGIFEIVPLLVQLSERYKKRAAVEVLTILRRHKFDVTTLFAVFAEAFSRLRPQVDGRLFPSHILAAPEWMLDRKHPYLTRHEIAKLERVGIIPREVS